VQEQEQEQDLICVVKELGALVRKGVCVETLAHCAELRKRLRADGVAGTVAALREALAPMAVDKTNVPGMLTSWERAASVIAVLLDLSTLEEHQWKWGAQSYSVRRAEAIAVGVMDERSLQRGLWTPGLFLRRLAEDICRPTPHVYVSNQGESISPVFRRARLTEYWLSRDDLVEPSFRIILSEVNIRVDGHKTQYRQRDVFVNATNEEQNRLRDFISGEAPMSREYIEDVSHVAGDAVAINYLGESSRLGGTLYMFDYVLKRQIQPGERFEITLDYEWHEPDLGDEYFFNPVELFPKGVASYHVVFDFDRCPTSFLGTGYSSDGRRTLTVPSPTYDDQGDGRHLVSWSLGHAAGAASDIETGLYIIEFEFPAQKSPSEESRVS